MERYFRDLVEGRRQAPYDRLLLAILRLPALCYALIMVLRAACYRHRLFRCNRLPRPTLSVGNLTVGGTGKTPTVAFLVRLLQERGKRVAVLSRGYGGSREQDGGLVSDGTTIFLSPAEAGDEPYLLAHSLPGLVVAVGADRYRAGLLALERCNPDIFILDDGFQHLRLARDLNILLLDGRMPFANGATLPAGLLREPVRAVSRADLVLFTRCDAGVTDAVDLPGIPACRSRHRLAGVRLSGNGALEAVASLGSKRVLAFAGIADPSSFFAALVTEGAHLAATLELPDHAVYGEAEFAELCRLRDASGATCLVTTEKDWVKLGPWLDLLGPVYVTVLQLEIEDDGPLRTALEKLL